MKSKSKTSVCFWRAQSRESDRQRVRGRRGQEGGHVIPPPKATDSAGERSVPLRESEISDALARTLAVPSPCLIESDRRWNKKKLCSTAQFYQILNIDFDGESDFFLTGFVVLIVLFV